MNKIIYLEDRIISLDCIVYIQIYEMASDDYRFQIKYKPLTGDAIIDGDEYFGKYKTRDEIETAFEKAKKTIQ